MGPLFQSLSLGGRKKRGEEMRGKVRLGRWSAAGAQHREETLPLLSTLIRHGVFVTRVCEFSLGNFKLMPALVVARG